MELSGIEEAVAVASARWPGYVFTVTSSDEAHGACPFEGLGEDRFFFNDAGHYHCRQCGRDGWLDDDKTCRALTLAEQNAARIAKLERETRKLEKRMSALEQMARCTDHLTYHSAMDEHDRKWWRSQGIPDDAQDAYKLGICYGCPTHPDHPISMTIPVFDSSGEVLRNIRHRLLGFDDDKYRPHMAGLGNFLFNAHLVRTERDLLLVEGEKKAIVCGTHGFPSVGIFGKCGFNLAWCKHFGNVRRLWIALDPDANGQALRLSKALAGELDHCEVRVCSFPVKPDDLFVDGGTERDFLRYLELARRV